MKKSLASRVSLGGGGGKEYSLTTSTNAFASSAIEGALFQNCTADMAVNMSTAVVRIGAPHAWAESIPGAHPSCTALRTGCAGGAVRGCLAAFRLARWAPRARFDEFSIGRRGAAGMWAGEI